MEGVYDEQALGVSARLKLFDFARLVRAMFPWSSDLTCNAFDFYGCLE